MIIDFVVEQLKRRNFTFDVDEFNKLEDQRKVIQVQTQELQNLRNTKSKAIGQDGFHLLLRAFAGQYILLLRVLLQGTKNSTIERQEE